MSSPDDEAVWFVQRRWGSKGWARVSGHVRDGKVLYVGVLNPQQRRRAGLLAGHLTPDATAPLRPGEGAQEGHHE